MTDEFEWRDEKAARNRRDHRVTFDQAMTACRDPFLVEWIDDRENYGEERVNLLGMCEDVLLQVTYTMRGDKFRIISARKATKNERKNYFRENSV